MCFIMGKRKRGAVVRTESVRSVMKGNWKKKRSTRVATPATSAEGDVATPATSADGGMTGARRQLLPTDYYQVNSVLRKASVTIVPWWW